MREFSVIRSALVLILMLGGFSALLGRVVYLQTMGREQTVRRADRQQHQVQTLRGRRGSIFDANGLLMAGTVQTQALFVDPKFMNDAFAAEGKSFVELDEALNKLAEIIDKDPFELSQLLSEKFESRYVKLAENLDQRTCDAIRELNIPGLGLEPMNERYYPMGSLAAHVLGIVGKEGSGLEGIEMKFDPILAGRNGYKRSLKDARRRSIAVAAEDYLPPEHGQHLILTIDANVQLITQQELAAACEKYRAKRGEAIVMDPRTGDIVAMANYPAFSPQHIEDSDPEIRRNRCLTDPYEPGSTIKPFIVGPALAGKVTRVNEVWPISGKSYKSPLRRKVITDVYPYGPLATWDVLVKSSNIGMTMLGERLGKTRLHHALESFGFGRTTGVALPGEDPGLLNPLKVWKDYSIPSVSQGYEVMVTPIQLARAFCAYANGGRLVMPRIVKGVLDEDGNVVSHMPPQPFDMLPEAIDPITAAEMKRVMADTLIRGTARSARSNTWNIFGKTGTAHVSTGGVYDEENYTSSFIGGAPAANPRLIVVLIVHQPDRDWAMKQYGSYYGGAVAAPAASRVLERSLSYLQIPAEPPLAPPPPHIASVLHNFSPKLYERKDATSASASAQH